MITRKSKQGAAVMDNMPLSLKHVGVGELKRPQEM
jgi:hypothetical protein